MLFVASDHAGYKLKSKLINYLKKNNIEHIDLGTNNEERVNFGDFAKILVNEVVKDESNKGVLICGTGIGMSIAANRNPKIRAALCKNVSTALLARQHNDANVLVLAGRQTCPYIAKNILKTFLSAKALGGIYEERMKQVSS